MNIIITVIALSILVGIFGVAFYMFWDYIINKEDKQFYGMLYRLEQEAINSIEVTEYETL